MKFQKFNSWINEYHEISKEENDSWEELHDQGITILYPGSFKPMTGGHLSLIKRYAENSFVNEIRVIVGPGIRNGIDQNLAFEIAKQLTKDISKVIIEKSQYPSPILTAYKMVEKLSPGNYALAASNKDDDYKRVKDFTEQHQPGAKYSSTIPEGVNIIEMPINVEPAIFTNRSDEYNNKPISASILRKDILNNDFNNFSTSYEGVNPSIVKNIWDMLKGRVTESLNEATIVADKNKHMTHAEDLVILSGEEGLKWVLQMLWNLYDELKGNTKKSDMKLSVKIDGAPAIMAWSKFNGLPDNGISMKGLFSKTPKYYTSNKDIDNEYSDKPQLAYKLKTFLKHLKNINIPKNEIWQGDFLFDDKSLQQTEINGEKFYAFHPNTIYYVVPENSDLGKLISKAEVGVTWHTRYTGKDLESVKANYNADVSELKLSDKILMTDPYIKSFAGNINFTEEESEVIEKIMENLLKYSKNLYGMNEYKDIVNDKDLISLFTIFQNSLIRTESKIEDPDGFIGEFIEFLQNRSLKEAEKRKTQKGKDQIIESFAEKIDNVKQNKEVWWLLVYIIINITKLKELFIKKLNNIGKFQTYLKMKEGKLKSTNQEGFAVSDIDGNVVKLVDRGEFSFANFSPDVQKGWSN